MDDTHLAPKKPHVLFLSAVIVGVLAGIFSWLFRMMIAFVHNAAFLGQWSVHYDANVHTPGSYLGWLIIFAPVLGGIVVVFLVKNFAPQTKGHGVPEVMFAIYHKQGIIPGHVSLVKAAASAITIGTGGSLGREGPIVHISAALSSFIGRIAKLSISQRNLLIACGASAGIAATFNAPLGGILFSIELLLISVNSRTVLAVAVSTVIAANVGHYLMGTQPAFSIPNLFDSIENGHIAISSLLSIPLGVLIGLLSLVFIKSIYFFEEAFDRFPVNDYLKHIIGMLILGILFYSVYAYFGHYYVQGVGYATIQDVLFNLITNPLFLFFLLIAKLLATGLTIGSGGSGGVFSPSLFLGAVGGAFFASLVNTFFPQLGIEPIIFVIAGMAAMVSGATSAPLTAAIIIYEMTLDYQSILPVMTAVSIAYAVRRSLMKGDIYTLKLNRRGIMVPEGLEVDLKSHITLGQVQSTNIEFASDDDVISADKDFICVTESDHVVSIVDMTNRHIDHAVAVKDCIQRRFIILHPSTTLTEASIQLHMARCALVLISKTGKSNKESIEGVVSRSHLMDALAEATAMLGTR